MKRVLYISYDGLTDPLGQSQILPYLQHLAKESYQFTILSFEKKVGNDRLIKACQRALDYGIYNYKTIQSILEKGLDKNTDGDTEQLEMPLHDNIRGEDYYQ